MLELQPPPPADRRRFTAEALRILVLLLLCLTVIHQHTIFSSFKSIEGGVDSMLINFVLEHERIWASGQPTHESLWSPPIFFPEKNTAAFVDLFLGVFPFYGVWRLFGADPQTAFQLWMLTISFLNFIAAYLILRILLRSSMAASISGA